MKHQTSSSRYQIGSSRSIHTTLQFALIVSVYLNQIACQLAVPAPNSTGATALENPTTTSAIRTSTSDAPVLASNASTNGDTNLLTQSMSLALATTNITSQASVSNPNSSSDVLSSDNRTQATSTTSSVAQRTVPVLRPSIEEVASELSKKYLNLEHEGGRRNRNSGRQRPPSVEVKNSTISGRNAKQTVEPEATKSVVSDAEHDIVQLLTGGASEGLQTGDSPANSSQSQTADVPLADRSRSLGDLFDEQPYSAAEAGTSSSLANNRTLKSRPTLPLKGSGRRKSNQARQFSKKKHASLLLHANNEDNELLLCQQYLQLYSSPLSSRNLETISEANSYPSDDIVSKLPSEWPVHYNHLSPCSCELREHFALGVLSEVSAESNEYVWLNCDHIQLNGIQFVQSNDLQPNKTEPNTNGESKPTGVRDNFANPSRYSQRDSGLQILFAQKFHYLQLNRLQSIDLSANRLRSIKMDAFHGLENTLEYLNLANNLLGDTRLVVGEETLAAGAQPAPGQRRSSQSNKSSGKSIFFSDELSRLQHLKWLSLKNNQIIQLAPQIFVRHSAAKSTNGNTLHFKSNQEHLDALNNGGKLYNQQQQKQLDGGATSELVHLDLSDNLLQSVPSESIQYLNKLRVLKLNGNRIAHLNQHTRFPNSIEYLDLSENLITVVRNCDLTNLPNLFELNLSANLLKQLDQTAFASLASVAHNSRGGLRFTHDFGSEISTVQDRNNLHQDSSRADAVQPLPNDATIVGKESRSNSRRIFGDDDGKQHGNVLTHSNEPISRRRRDIQQVGQEEKNDDLEIDESIDDANRAELSIGSDDLDMDESIFASVKERIRNNNQQPTIGEELNSGPPPSGNSPSLLRLNLSYNFLETIPGDSLVKFSNLQQLDLSFNRIRELDPNYLCSIYNLVENLRILDISGNLLELGKQIHSPSMLAEEPNNVLHYKQLNKFFGCMQKLEKLLLSTNRLASTPSPARPRVPNFNPQSAIGLDDVLLSDGSEISETHGEGENVRPSLDELLSIKFGENFGNKNLNTLDLSDNKLKQMPIIEQVIHPLVLSPNTDLDNPSSNGTRTTIAPNQTQLNQWISSRIYLEVLNLNYNQLERLNENEFEHLFNLRQLHLDFNKLSVLPVKLLRRFTSLDRLSLAGNRLTSLDPLNELLERSSRTLRSLNLANNRLMDWPLLSRPIAANEYAAQQVEAKNLGFSDQTTTKQMLLEFALEELNLEGNRLTSFNVTPLFDQLVHMKSLRKLNLNYNLLNRIKSEWFKFANRNLQKLSLSGNKINNIDLGSFALNQVNELTSLELEFNLLKELKRKTFDSMPKLHELNLAHNLIHTINSETFYQMNALKILKLNNNRLTSWKCEYFSHLCNSISGNINVDLASLSAQTQQQASGAGASAANLALPPTVSSLIELDLSHNSLSQLRANSISAHTKLVRLNLAHNKLSFIPHDLFKANTLAPNGRQVYLVSSLRYLNLEHNRIQTIDNVNFRPLKNLISLDLSHNELQTLGMDVVTRDSSIANGQRYHSNRHMTVSNNLTNLLAEEDYLPSQQYSSKNQTLQPKYGGPLTSASNWPGLCKLRHLNLAFNQLTLVNQSLLSELSPFVLLNLNLSNNYLDSESLPSGFYTKLTVNQNTLANGAEVGKVQNYDLVYTLKLESLDLSHNRLEAYPSSLLDNHYSSMESCNISHNRIQILPHNSNSMIHIKSFNFEFNPLSRESSELLLFEQRSVRYLNLAATRLYSIQQATVDTMSNPLITYTNAQMRNRLINQTSQLDLIRSISKPIDAPYLRHLNLSSNQLVWLAGNVFERMHSLQTLDLSNNQLTRLHLLNKQLLYVAPSLEFLNIGTNLFTNIDSNDFSQLTALRHLDMSNLLSLQKLNCQFLSRMVTLKVLKMFNYPQLRNRLANLVATLTQQSSQKTGSADKIRYKLREDLILSTIGQHCFIETGLPTMNMQEVPLHISDRKDEYNLNWFNLEELELELYNNFNSYDNISQVFVDGGKFELQNELHQLLGPRLRKLTLFGLNLTSLSDDSLLGITNEDFRLKISYTSLSQLPLKQIFGSVTKRTKLDLDLRNNNIQTIDMIGLQLLDELQQNAQALSPRNEFQTLKLASNPFRCDCHSRPLWLWLNQRWEKVEVPSISDELIGDTSSGNSANYYLKVHPFIPHTSDLKCFYPAKLRGKLAQHVNYNELICRGSSSATSTQSSGSNNPRPMPNKRRPNDTSVRLSESYYLSSLNNESSDFDDLEDEDYLDASESRADSATVRVTRFNRFPPAISNTTTIYFTTNFPIPSLATQNSNMDIANSELQNRIGKRNQHSVPTATSFAPAMGEDPSQAPVANTKYSKHRPNSQQKHSPFNTVSNLNHFQFGRGLHARNGGVGAQASDDSPIRRSLLTDSDVFILTIASAAMIIMSLVIVTICLFKFRMDHSDREQMLAAHGKGLFSHQIVGNEELSNIMKKNSHTSTKSSSSSNDSNESSDKNQSSSDKTIQPQGTESANKLSNGLQSASTRANHKTSADKIQRLYASQILVPISHHEIPILGRPIPFGANNFLMRSPTIRRVHGLASNAGDWLRCTLRPNPKSNSTDEKARRCLYISSNDIESSGAHKKSQPIKSQQKLASTQGLGCSLSTGCPLHAFKCIQKLRAASKWHSAMALNESQCSYCSSLLAAYQQTKVQLPVLMKNLRSNANESTGGGSKTINQLSEQQMQTQPIQSNRQQAQQVKVRDFNSNNMPIPLGDEVKHEMFKQIITPKAVKTFVKQPDDGGAPFLNRIANVAQIDTQQLPPKVFISKRDHYQAHNNSKNDCNNQRESAKYYSRELPMRSMRTFGGNQGISSKFDDSSRISKAQHSDRNSTDTTNNGQISSQIPTIDVDGRFAYQSDSQIETTSAYDAHNSGRTDALGRNTPSSTVATNQEDIFILVHDTPSRRTSQSSFVVSRNGNADSIDQLTTDGGQALDVGSSMHDECSRTSSPVAYGFMRSTPSATTLSSTTNSKNRYAIERKSFVFSPEDYADELNIYQQVIDRFRQTTSGREDSSYGQTKVTTELDCNISLNDDNGNSLDYSVVRKNKPTNIPAQSIVASSNHVNCDSDTNQSTSDQIIISRL